MASPGQDTYTDVPLFVILDIYGTLYFAPTFNDFDFYTMDVSPGEMDYIVLSEFIWPEATGSGEATWYAAMTNPEITELVGDFDSWTFGWRP